MPDDSCPCGSTLPLSTCCGRFHNGQEKAPTAEALMRSRYSAFALQNSAYLLRTLHPQRRSADEIQQIERSFAGIQWQALLILDRVEGSESDNTGIVEFVAEYDAEGRRGHLHERSHFVKENGEWFYTRGETGQVAMPGRNDPCWCGSGRKFKKCHG
ncbi:MAG TPA: YchJ family metal-binding protein [Dongiaceae bacterium]|nr:YchJ family metal-binding protein [Dongiaceae bacterium]